MNSTSNKTLTIGMATYDDYDGVYFSVMCIRLFHPEVTDETEIVVVDNHPDGQCAADLKALENWISGYRYVTFNRFQSTAVCDMVFREAAFWDIVLCMDCHVMFAPGALRRLIDYFQSHPSAADLLQGPLVYDDLRSFSSHIGIYLVFWACMVSGARPAGIRSGWRTLRDRHARLWRLRLPQIGLAGFQSTLTRIWRWRRLHSRKISTRGQPHAVSPFPTLDSSVRPPYGGSVQEYLGR